MLARFYNNLRRFYAKVNAEVLTEGVMDQRAAVTRSHATGTYGIKSWDEKTWDGKDHKDQPGAKLTHAKIVFTLHGDVEGEASVQLVMAYRNDSYATFVGLQQLVGRVGNRTGSCVFKVDGVFENGAAMSTWSVIPGSGTGDLHGIRGEASTVAHHGDTQPFAFDYYFE